MTENEMLKRLEMLKEFISIEVEFQERRKKDFVSEWNRGYRDGRILALQEIVEMIESVAVFDSNYEMNKGWAKANMEELK